MHKGVPVAATIIAICLGGVSPAAAQSALLSLPDVSQHARVLQRVGITDITIDYHRPFVRGRKIFGGLQPYGSIWRAGANFNTTIEVGDDVTIGSRSMVTQGARVGDGSVLGEGVILNPGIPVIDAETGEEVSRGVVPPWCIVVQAMRPRTFPGGEFYLPCALIIRRLTEGERADKAKLNDILRDHGVAT